MNDTEISAPLSLMRTTGTRAACTTDAIGLSAEPIAAGVAA